MNQPSASKKHHHNAPKENPIKPKIQIVVRDRVIYKSRSLTVLAIKALLAGGTLLACAAGGRTLQNYNTEKAKVADGQMTLTNYGWLDTNHAIPDGPKALIDLVQQAPGHFEYTQRGIKHMARGLITLHLYAGGKFTFDPNATSTERVAIAYTVLREITEQFEHTQAWTINTGVGDLNGNNLSFWRALHDKSMDEAQTILNIRFATPAYGVKQFNDTVFYIPEDKESLAFRDRMGLTALMKKAPAITAHNMSYGAKAEIHAGGHHINVHVLDNVTKEKKL